MQLVTEDTLAKLAVTAPSTEGIDPASFNEASAASALRMFLTLSQQPESFIAAGWSAESVFWSRYYWFRRFANIQSAKTGADPGLDQQALQILEYPFPPCSPDWSQLEAVNMKAAVK